MAKKDKYVAYVGTYTHENSVGIHVYDIDTDNGNMTERSVTPINNPSYVCVSKDGQYLYSIADEGVAAFKIDENGDLTPINRQWIGGMRGCYVEVDEKRRYLFVAGFHDGRVTMMKLKKDGSIGDISDGIFHQGHAISSSERRLDHPKVSCAKLTKDQKYLCAADYGLNQVKVYKVDYRRGKLRLEDIIRCSMDSNPRTFRFSADGKYMYIVCESANEVEVYEYSENGGEPNFELIQKISSTDIAHQAAASSSMCLSFDGKHAYVSVDGLNMLSMYEVQKDGTLKSCGTSPVSGDYPKSLAFLPGDEDVAVLNHDSNEIRLFHINHEKHYMLMQHPPIKVDKPNCIRIHKLITDKE